MLGEGYEVGKDSDEDLVAGVLVGDGADKGKAVEDIGGFGGALGVGGVHRGQVKRFGLK